MLCPHCQVGINPDFTKVHFHRFNQEFEAPNAAGGKARWHAELMTCPVCKKAIIKLIESAGLYFLEMVERYIVPHATSRPTAPPEVPTDLAEDYNEACAVMDSSPKASAALSRRCLQGILRSNGYTQKDLAPAIDALLKSKTLHSGLEETVDAIRNIGNFAAHPMKDTNTGAILPVEPHEAEWNLEVLEGLFDFFYVAPAKARKRRAALNAKLEAANKPPMK